MERVAKMKKGEVNNDPQHGYRMRGGSAVIILHTIGRIFWLSLKGCEVNVNNFWIEESGVKNNK